MDAIGSIMCSFPACMAISGGLAWIERNGVFMATCGEHNAEQWKAYISRLKARQRNFVDAGG